MHLHFVIFINCPTSLAKNFCHITATIGQLTHLLLYMSLESIISPICLKVHLRATFLI